MKQSVVLCLLLCAVTFVPQNLLALDQNAILERTKQVQSMSKVDRDRLDRNIQSFQVMDENQRTHFRQFHADLLEDRSHSGGLSAALQTYSLWLQTLSPAHREEIRNESDPARKLSLVKKIKEEIESAKAAQEPNSDPAMPQPGLRFPAKGVLDSKDLASVMKVVVERLPQERRTLEFDRPQLNNYLQIMTASAQLSGGFREWPDEAQLQQMVAAIKNTETSANILKASSRRETLLKSVLTGILKQAVDSVRFPTSDERLQVFEALTHGEREHLMSFPTDEMTRILNQKYFASKNDDSFKALPIYHKQVLDMFDRMEVQPPPRLTRPKGRPPQERG